MGSGIAQVCAAAGCAVLLHDSSPEAIERGLGVIGQDLLQAVKRGKLAQEDADATMARISPSKSLGELANCDLVVEAIIERLDAKQTLFRDLEDIVGTNCILATNTSSLSVTAIAAACKKPERIAGWHFFNPVPRMRVVEVIQAPRTDPNCTQALALLSKRVGHRAIVTSDSPGFVVNHAGRAFVTEGLKLLAEQVADHATLDSILRSCAGFRMGPFELLDLTALDVSVPVMESIYGQYYSDDRYRPAAFARTRMVAGLLGRKTNQGFYKYERGATQPSPVEPPAESPLPTLWWPTEGSCAVPDHVATLLAPAQRAITPEAADVILLSPLESDLSTAIVNLGLDPGKGIGIDPIFAGLTGVTLMVTPATRSEKVVATQAIFATQGIAAYQISDSAGFVAPRVVACIVNLACEMAQQGIASPVDIDAAVRLGLGYPAGPFEWGDRLGPGPHSSGDSKPTDHFRRSALPSSSLVGPACTPWHVAVDTRSPELTLLYEFVDFLMPHQAFICDATRKVLQALAWQRWPSTNWSNN
jgi:3-hydroxybutyryl-CoA dehydrogenase